MFGFLNVYKPSGISSHKVISILRKITGIKQIGHAGTLDPLAQGVLPVAIGRATKLIDYLEQDKRYIAGLEFGKRSDTFDIEGNIEIVNSKPVKFDEIEEILKQFRGEIKQIPPVYSAVHYQGKRLYELARKGTVPDDIPSRIVTIKKIEIVEFLEEEQRVKIDIECSKGTYVRSIVNDIGELTGSGAIMYELTRMKSGGLEIDGALKISENTTKAEIENNLINPLSLLPLECIEIDEQEYNIIKHGNRINRGKNNTLGEVLLSYRGKITALAQVSERYIQPKKIF